MCYIYYTGNNDLSRRSFITFWYLKYYYKVIKVTKKIISSTSLIIFTIKFSEKVKHLRVQTSKLPNRSRRL